jgi:hypothetical protein
MTPAPISTTTSDLAAIGEEQLCAMAIEIRAEFPGARRACSARVRVASPGPILMRIC